jgi:hypothetical protein
MPQARQAQPHYGGLSEIPADQLADFPTGQLADFQTVKHFPSQAQPDPPVLSDTLTGQHIAFNSSIPQAISSAPQKQDLVHSTIPKNPKTHLDASSQIYTTGIIPPISAHSSVYQPDTPAFEKPNPQPKPVNPQPLPNFDANGGTYGTNTDDFSEFEDMDDEAEPTTGTVGTESLPNEILLSKNNGFGQVMGESDGLEFVGGSGRGGHRENSGLGEVFGESDQNRGFRGKDLNGGKDGSDMYA